TDRADVYCGVVDIQPNQLFSIYGSDTAIAPSTLYVNAYRASSWATPAQSLGVCGSNGTVWCDIGPDQQATQALLIVAPFGSSQDPINFDMQGVCVVGCSIRPQAPVFTSIRPASQAAGPDNTVVVSGTGLNFRTPFNLMAEDGSAYSPAVPV